MSPIRTVAKTLGATALAITAFVCSIGLTPAVASAKTTTTTTSDFSYVACAYASQFNAAFELRFWGKVLANRTMWRDPRENWFIWREITNQRVAYPVFTVKTYNKCGRGRKSKTMKNTLAVTTGWAGQSSTINWNPSVALNFAGGISIGITPSAGQKKWVRETVTSTNAKRKSWTAHMSSGPLKWKRYQVTLTSEYVNRYNYPAVQLYVHPFVRYNGTSGSDYYDFGVQKITLK